MKKFILLSFLFTLVFTACEDEIITPPVEEEVQEINVSVKNQFEGSDVVFASTDYTLASGEEVYFTRIAYILSNFSLKKSDGSLLELPDQYVLVNPKFDAPNFTLKNIPMGDYTDIQFSLGLDSVINYGNPAQYPSDHPLNPLNNSLHWNWAGGYIFTALEGKLSDGSESFVFHLAGSKHKIDYSLPLSLSKAESAAEAELTFDVAEVFKNPTTYNLATDGFTTHNIDDATTATLFGNMKDVFSIQ